MAASPAPSCTIRKFAEIPITMRGLRPIATVKINGKEHDFILDSGAFFSALSSGDARDLGLKLTPAPYGLTVSGVGGTASVQVATVKDFGYVGRSLANVQFIVGGSDFETTGLIGQNMLGKHDVEYDFPHGAVRLMESDGCAKTNLAYWSKPGEFYATLKIDDRAAAGWHTVGDITINGAHVDATFDTGAPLTTLSLAAAARANVKPTMPGAQPGGPISGIGRRTTQSWIVPAGLIRIGGEEIKNARIRIGDLGPGLDMLIGADFFIAHRIYVSNAYRRMFLTYTGGPMFDLHARWGGDPSGTTGSDPGGATADLGTDAAALARRAGVLAAQHENERALADLDRAIVIAPSEPRYLLQRAAIHVEADDLPAASADLDRAIQLKDDDAEARMIRATLHLKKKRKPEAIADLDSASKALGQAADRRLDIASLYAAAGALPAAIEQANLWIANHPVNSRRAQALNERCWYRALSKVELPAALADCNAALRLAPATAAYLDSRALVRLRMGDTAKAIADYDAALARMPTSALTFYGRSLAHKALGQDEAAKADRDTAIKLYPEVVDHAHEIGLDS